MQVKCLHCGHAVHLDSRTYTSYTGPIKCNICRTVIRVKIQDGRVQEMTLVAANVS